MVTFQVRACRPVAVDVARLAQFGPDAVAAYAGVEHLTMSGERCTSATVAELYGVERDRMARAIAVLMDARILIDRTESDDQPDEPFDLPRPRPKVTPRRYGEPPEWRGAWPLNRDLDLAPRQAVVYHLFKDDELRYVGMTEHLAKRLRQHHKAGRHFDRWEAFACADRPSACAFEIECIKRLRPPENRGPGGDLSFVAGWSGRPPGARP
jgi:hypothetical protein